MQISKWLKLMRWQNTPLSIATNICAKQWHKLELRLTTSIEQSKGDSLFKINYYLWATNQDQEDMDCNIVDSKEDANMQKGLKH